MNTKTKLTLVAALILGAVSLNAAEVLSQALQALSIHQIMLEGSFGFY